MIQKFRRARRWLAAGVLLASLSVCTPAFAQLDYDTYDIYQGGAIVGTIYVPQRGPDPSNYTEYWILSSHYVYPGVKNEIVTEIVHSPGYHYTSLADFFAKAPWAQGYRFITVNANDVGVLPGRTTTVAATVAK